MGDGTNIQKWGSWNDDDAKKEKAQAEAKGGSFIKLGTKTVLRQLPPKAPMKSPFIITYQHFHKVNGVDVKCNCPRRMKKLPCPFCAKANKMLEEAGNNKQKQDAAKKWFPKLRVYAAAVDRNNEDKGPAVFAFGKVIYDQLLDIREDDGDYTSVGDGGQDIVVKKSGEGRDTDYKVKLAQGKSPLSEDAKQMDEWFEAYPDLTQYATVPTAADITDMINAAIAGKSDDDEEDERPARPRHGARESGSGGGARRGSHVDTDGEDVTPTKVGGSVDDDNEDWEDN
jgi:hypothetical protein